MPVPFPQPLGSNQDTRFFDPSTQFTYPQNPYPIPFNPDINYDPSSDLQNWSDFNMDLQNPMAWSNPFPTLNPSIQTPTLPSQTPQPVYIPSFQGPPTSDPYRSSGGEIPAAAFGPSPFVEAQPTAGPDPTYRFPANISSDSSLSTPSDGPHATLAPSLPSSTEEIRTIPDLSILSGPEASHVTLTSRIDPIEGITERLGEFLFNPKEKTGNEVQGSKRRKPKNGYAQPDRRDSVVTLHGKSEQDGLTDEVREVL